jgi:hypothetical protein
MSIRLAAVFAAASAAVVAYPSLLLSLTDNFPASTKAFISGAVFVLMFGIPTLTALIKQPKLEAKVEVAKAAAVDAEIKETDSGLPD